MAIFDYSKNDDDAFDAIATFERYLQEGEPVFLESYAYERIVQHYTEEGEWDKAEIAIDWAMQFHPFCFELRIARVRVFAAIKDYETTMQALEECEQLQPLDPEVKLVRGNVMMAYGYFKEAREDYQKAVSEAPDNPQALYALGYVSQCLAEYPEAIERFKATLIIDDSFEDAALDLIHCTLVVDKLDQSIQFFEKRLDSDPYAGSYWMYLGIARFEQREWKKASRAFEYATITESDNGMAYERLGHALMNQKKFEEAALAYESAIEVQGEQASLYCHLGASYEKQDDYRRAYRFYRKAKDLDQLHANAWFGMASCLIEKEQWMEAINFLKKAISINRHSADFWLSLGIAENALSNYQACEEAFGQASAIGGENADIWLRWSMIHYQQGNLKRALEIVCDGLDELPDNPDLNYSACAYYLYHGEYQKAFYYLEVGLHLDYERHEMLYEMFPSNTMKKAIARLVREIVSDGI